MVVLAVEMDSLYNFMSSMMFDGTLFMLAVERSYLCSTL